MRRTTLVGASLSVALLAVAAPAASADDHKDTGLGIRLVDAPVARRDDPRASVYVVDHVSPGTSFSRRVEVVNDTPTPVTVQLYAAPAGVDGGGFNVGPQGGSGELTDWMVVTPSSLVLAPRARAMATARFSVPQSASSGERYAAVVAQPPPASTGGPIAVQNRVAVRVYLDVGPGGEPASDFTVSTLTPARDAQGNPVVTAQVTNTGGRALDLSGQLELSDGPGGLRAGPFDADVRTLGIGGTGDVRVPLDKALPPGPWKGRLVMRSGRVEHAVEATFTFPATAGATAAPVKAEPVPLTKDPNVLVPIAVGLIALVLAGLLWLLWRRRRRDDDEDDAQPLPPLPGQRRAADEQVDR